MTRLRTAAPRSLLTLTLALIGVTSLSGCGVISDALDSSESTHIAGTRGAPLDEDEDLGSVEVYEVSADAELSPEPNEAAAHVWNLWLQIVTPEVAGAVILDFRVGDAEDSSTMAYVLQSEDPTLWTLAANLAFASEDDLLISTLVHEYAHILSLSPDQVDPDAQTCDTLQLDEGCALPDSAIYEFYEQFWRDYGDDAPDPTNADSDVADAFYADHEDDFVSDYAATNVVEDFAETFMTFVIEDEPSGDTVAADKMRFFWDRADDVSLRERIRSDLGYA